MTPRRSRANSTVSDPKGAHAVPSQGTHPIIDEKEKKDKKDKKEEKEALPMAPLPPAEPVPEDDSSRAVKSEILARLCTCKPLIPSHATTSAHTARALALTQASQHPTSIG